MTAKYKSVFDIIGPIMVGPSSSHTAGAARIGYYARQIFKQKPIEVDIYLYGSFGKTYRGHGTDIALVGGLLQMLPDDPRLPESLALAYKEGIEVCFIPSKKEMAHPNTVKILMKSLEKRLAVTGISIGGGNIEISKVEETINKKGTSMSNHV
jgi:L-serine dehydratase